MIHMFPCRNRKDLIQLLQGQRLRLGQTEIGKDPAGEVPGRVPAERALRGERLDERRPCQGDDKVEAPGGGGGEGHAYVTDV